MMIMPGYQGNIVNRSPVIGMDIPATIYALTDTTVADLDGQSLSPLLANQSVQQRVRFFGIIRMTVIKGACCCDTPR